MAYYYRIKPEVDRAFQAQRVNGIKITRNWVRTEKRIKLGSLDEYIEESKNPEPTGRRKNAG